MKFFIIFGLSGFVFLNFNVLYKIQFYIFWNERPSFFFSSKANTNRHFAESSSKLYYEMCELSHVRRPSCECPASCELRVRSLRIKFGSRFLGVQTVVAYKSKSLQEYLCWLEISLYVRFFHMKQTDTAVKLIFIFYNINATFSLTIQHLLEKQSESSAYLS